MSHSILFAVKKTDVIEHELTRSYDQAVSVLAGIARTNKNARLLGEGAILFPLNEGLESVQDVLSTMNALAYSYAILTEELQFYEKAKKDEVYS